MKPAEKSPPTMKEFIATRRERAATMRQSGLPLKAANLDEFTDELEAWWQAIEKLGNTHLEGPCGGLEGGCVFCISDAEMDRITETERERELARESLDLERAHGEHDDESRFELERDLFPLAERGL